MALRVTAERQASLCEALLGAGVGVLPADLVAVDVLLDDRGIYAPIGELWRERDAKHGTMALTEGRPTVAIETFVRLIVLKAKLGWGYGRLVREVSDSIQVLRLGQRVAEFTAAEATVDQLVGAMTGSLELSARTQAKLDRS